MAKRTIFPLLSFIIVSLPLAAGQGPVGIGSAKPLQAPPAFFLPQGVPGEKAGNWVLSGRDASFLFHPGGVTVGYADGTSAELEFLDADLSVSPRGESPAATRVTRFDGRQGGEVLPACTRVVYAGLKPGVDLVFTASQNRLTAGFAIRSGAGAERPRLSWRGTPPPDRAIDTGSGSDRISAPGGEATLPAADSAAGGLEIAYCGYLANGGAHDYGYGIAVDSAGCAYVTGNVYDDYLNTSPPVRKSFLAKVSADGSVLEYVALFGAGISVNDVAVDASGCAYIVGEAFGTAALAVKTGPDLTYNGGDCDAYLAKLDSLGTDLVYAGYIGGANRDCAQTVALSGSGDLWVGGWTTSKQDTFPVRGGPSLVLTKSSAAWAAKVKADGSDLLLCGYLEGDTAYGLETRDIAVNGNGDAYLCGDGWGDGQWTWWAKLRGSSGQRLFYTEGEDYSNAGNGIGLDGNGHVYLFDGHYVRKYSPADIPQLEYDFRYLDLQNGDNTPRVTGLAVDSAGRAWVCGYRQFYDANWKLVNVDAFVGRVAADGSGWDFTRIFGGGQFDWVNELALDAQGAVYLVGYTESSQASFPVKTGPGLLFDATAGNVSDVFVAKLVPPPPSVTLTAPNGGEKLVLGASFTIRWAPVNLAGAVNLLIFQNGSRIGSIATGLPAASGSYAWKVGDWTGGMVTAGSGYSIRVRSSLNGAIRDDSDSTFSIGNPPARSITVVSPKAGSSKSRGYTYKISWIKNGAMDANVKITLLRNGVLVQTIVAKTANNGTYAWAIPASLAAGGGYLVRVSTCDGKVKGDSGIFYLR